MQGGGGLGLSFSGNRREVQEGIVDLAKDLVGIEVGLNSYVMVVHLFDLVLALSFALSRHQVHQFSQEVISIV